MGERVRIIGSHPHRGASGTVIPEKRLPSLPIMEYVALDMNGYGVDACYADRRNLRPLSPDEDQEAERG